MYAITTDPQKSLVRMELLGFWDLEILARFQTELKNAVDSLHLPNSYLILVNALKSQPQSREVTTALFEFMDQFEAKARRLAFVTESAVLAMQARRLFDRPGFHLSATLEDAEAFLLDEG